jgi:hypothetical protein
VRRTVELFAGASYSFPTPLTIRQDSEPDIRLTAHYSTRPWRDVPYYAYRFGYQDGAGAWEAELVHQKIYFENPPADVQRFEVTHGYNLLTVNRANVRPNGTTLRLGVGLVIGHPEATVRGRASSGRGGIIGKGYFLSGVTVQLAVGRRLPDHNDADGLFLEPEAKLTASWARVPIAGGSATAPNVAVHGLLGVGYAY